MPHRVRGGTMQIGELAERTGLSLRTIRHYDDVGLLPASRTEGGFRVYTEQDVERLLVVRQMKPLGFTLEEMAELLELLGAEPASPERLADYLERARPERDKLARKLAQADEFIALLEHRLGR
ncbi:MerR family transcriptional regulator [Kocuria sediminis]|uniref:MerR family transcriptional regulator n=1 Tax=Kocuria sediminis TaxID=1038857 RepID=A0A6N8GGQ9_9MICC|nr:MerR family transcriptional regulator [Kocuria sediminis]MUN62108.1 MerR family transcriptional regulator [Kocuria sediminis]